MEANFLQFDTPQFRLLSDRQLEKLHFASLEILETTGVSIDCDEAIELLDGAGADVSDPKRVKIPSCLVEQAIRRAPKNIILYKRDGTPYIRLNRTRTYFGGMPDMPDYMDPRTRSRRPCKIRDVADMGRLIDFLPNIAWSYTAGWAGYAGGIPGKLADRVSLKLVLENCTKPVIACITDLSNLKDMLEICAIAAGGYEQLRRKPFFCGTVEPVTPLQHGRDGLEKSLLCAEYGIPNVVYTMLMGGGTAPATFAGILALANAEILSHLTVIQLKRPGAPVIYGAMPNIMEMRTAICPYGAPELSLLVGALTELCHYHQLPMFGTAGCTDAKTIGIQAGFEIMYQCMLSAFTGANFVHDGGLMDHATMMSPDLLVLIDEAVDMVRVSMNGIQVDDETLALDLIHKVGPGGNFLSTDHTYRHFRNFWVPALMDRTERPSGAETQEFLHAEDLANRKTLEILTSHEPLRMDADVLKEIEKVERSWFEKLDMPYRYPE